MPVVSKDGNWQMPVSSDPIPAWVRTIWNTGPGYGLMDIENLCLRCGVRVHLDAMNIHNNWHDRLGDK